MSRLQPVVHLLTQPSLEHLILLLGLVGVLAAVTVLAARLAPSTILSIGVGTEVFAGTWKYMHIPLPLDRVIFLFGLLLLMFGGVRRVTDRRLVFSPIHVLMAALVVYVALSALWAGTLFHTTGFYALLDRLGVIPFLMFVLAPLLYRTAKARDRLLRVLVVVGLYLGLTACFEGVGLHALVFPRYILNSNLGIHFGRARGPFLESVADGLSMCMCMLAAGVALTQWRHRLARLLCWVTILTSIVGGIFTLTRTVWICEALALLVPMLVDKKLRRYVPVVLVAGAVGSVAIIGLVPGLSTKVSARTSEASPVWDRYNTNDAAVRAWEQSPVFGIGWETFPTKGPSYLQQAGTYPLTGAGLEVHNVLLSHVVELGVPGAVMWVVALLSVVGGACFRRGPPDLYAWRLGLIGLFAAYFVAANLGPMSYPFPNLLLWFWAGIVSGDRYSVLRIPDRLPAGSAELPLLSPVGV